MIPYPHPPENLAIFQARLSTDAHLTDTYTVQCGRPYPIDAVVGGENDCDDFGGRYNTKVDVGVAGGYVGELRLYPYNRIDLATLCLPIGPLLKGDAETLADLLPAINAALGTHLATYDILATPIPICDCACGPIGVDLVADPLSLIYTGWLRLYIHTHPLPLTSVICRPFLSALPLPALTP